MHLAPNLRISRSRQGPLHAEVNSGGATSTSHSKRRAMPVRTETECDLCGELQSSYRCLADGERKEFRCKQPVGPAEVRAPSSRKFRCSFFTSQGCNVRRRGGSPIRICRRVPARPALGMCSVGLQGCVDWCKHWSKRIKFTVLRSWACGHTLPARTCALGHCRRKQVPVTEAELSPRPTSTTSTS